MCSRFSLVSFWATRCQTPTNMLSFALYLHGSKTNWVTPLSAKLGLKPFGCFVIIRICFACSLALAMHHSRRLPLNDFLMNQFLITGSPSVMNLDVFSTPIKANIAYLYLLPSGRLTFPPFDTLLYHIGIRT